MTRYQTPSNGMEQLIKLIVVGRFRERRGHFKREADTMDTTSRKNRNAHIEIRGHEERT